ncbi:hypothetical protein QF004_002117 [Chryseobacterium sp. MDT2-18]|nr:hypothetical protein [Chryseobacterium sp. MDT2-18]
MLNTEKRIKKPPQIEAVIISIINKYYFLIVFKRFKSLIPT